MGDTTLRFATYMFLANVLTKENYEVMTKLDELPAMDQAAVLLHFLREGLSDDPMKYVLFLQAIKKIPSLEQFWDKIICIG